MAEADLGRKYKDYKIYCFFALNRLVSELNIDLSQEGLAQKLDALLSSKDYRVTKEDIKHEIRSNHHMTNKVLQSLEEDGLIEVVRGDKGYSLRITKAGVLHVVKYSEFYREIYGEAIRQHYSYTGLPRWFK